HSENLKNLPRGGLLIVAFILWEFHILIPGSFFLRNFSKNQGAGEYINRRTLHEHWIRSGSGWDHPKISAGAGFSGM
ncbi:hypothetical protein, partial [Faecalibaculum rodentium]|uniref:hypothetical protein n=1 Tax=Faecalibaculum rodentium TaxID=1702221 RepID=UPI0025A5E73F